MKKKLMKNKHIPVMLDEVKSFIPNRKNINVIDVIGKIEKRVEQYIPVKLLDEFDAFPVR